MACENVVSIVDPPYPNEVYKAIHRNLGTSVVWADVQPHKGVQFFYVEKTEAEIEHSDEPFSVKGKPVHRVTVFVSS